MERATLDFRTAADFRPGAWKAARRNWLAAQAAGVTPKDGAALQRCSTVLLWRALGLDEIEPGRHVTAPRLADPDRPCAPLT